jgi:hypothetical protein
MKTAKVVQGVIWKVGRVQQLQLHSAEQVSCIIIIIISLDDGKV